MTYRGQRVLADAGDLFVLTGAAARHGRAEFKDPRPSFRQIDEATYQHLAKVWHEALLEAQRARAEREAEQRAAQEAEARRLAEQAELAAFAREQIAARE